MESEEGESSIPFQLQFDKPIPFQVLLLFLFKVCSFFFFFVIFKDGFAFFSYGGKLRDWFDAFVD